VRSALTGLEMKVLEGEEELTRISLQITESLDQKNKKEAKYKQLM